MRTIKSFNAVISCLLVLASNAGFAAVITVTQSPTGRATFGGNDIVNWGQLGPDGTNVPSPFTATSTFGVGLTVSEPAPLFERRDQPRGWGGNFTDGPVLLWTRGFLSGPVDIDFHTAIAGVGFQINPDGTDTNTTVDVYGAGNILFGSFNLTTADRSAPSADFIGFTSNAADIARITISQLTDEDFAINQLSLITTSIPEPSSLALLGVGLAGLGFTRRKRAAN